MELGPRIKSLREAAGLTQIELSKILKISNTTLSQYETGARVPGDEIKSAIADHFGVTLDYLYGRTEQIEGPTSVTEDGLDGEKRALIDKIRYMDSATVAALNQLADSIIAKRP